MKLKNDTIGDTPVEIHVNVVWGPNRIVYYNARGAAEATG